MKRTNLTHIDNICIMNEEESISIYDECVICYYSITDKNYIEPCRHPVHIDCFLLTKKSICPICRQFVTFPKTSNNIIDDYTLTKKMQITIISIVLMTYILVTLWVYATDLKFVGYQRTNS